MADVFIVLEVIGIFMIFVALGLLLYGDGAREKKLMVYFMYGALIQNAGYLLELTAGSMEVAITAVKIQYLGSLFIPICYCWFMFSYCFEKPPMRLFRVLAFVDIAMLAMIFTCERHSLYYRGVEWLETADGHGYMNLSYGPLYYIFLICGCAVPYALSIYALCRAVVLRPDHAASRKYREMVGLSLLPVIALFAYSMKLTQVFDPTPLVLGGMLSAVVILVWSRRNYDFNYLASGVVLNSMADGVIALNDQRKIVSFNPAAEAIFPKLAECMTGDDIESVEDFPRHVLHENIKGEFRIHDRLYESHVKKIPDKNGENQGYVILVLDVTETKKYITEIERVREQAEKANMAKSEFLANMSHEIRTPMNAITGLSDLIMEESRGRKIYSYACDVKSAAQNLLAIINDILDLSKIEAGKMELVLADYYVKTVVDEVVNMMDIAASQRGLLMKCEYDGGIPCGYYGDAGRIKQILINLLNNAVKFTKEGHVRMTVGGQGGPEEGTELLRFEVEDTGCGIREEDLEKIFENFQQVDSKRNRSVEGTGLGLSITKRLVQMMGGTIEVRSVYGEGTVFTVTIPQKVTDSRTISEMPEPPTREENQLQPFRADGYPVLVVDDNLINRKVAIGFLKRYGFEITEADSGPRAIELVREKKFEIIFMDHMMPEMDGIEAVRIIRSECGENGRSPNIIALTANAMEGVREKFLESGFQDFLTKPLDRGKLNEILEKWVPEDRRKPQESLGEPMSGERDPEQEGEETFDRIAIEGIDLEEAKQHHSGDLADYRELLHLYCMDGRRKLGLLRELFEQNDYKTYEIEVHGLKSASANIGAMKLSAFAKEHEEAASRGDIEFIALHVSELLSAYARQVGEIQKYLDRTSSAGDNGADEDLRELDRETLLRELKEALSHLEQFRSRECAHKIEELLKYRLDDDMRTKLQEIAGQLKMYEDDAAEELLNRLIKDREE